MNFSRTLQSCALALCCLAAHRPAAAEPDVAATDLPRPQPLEPKDAPATFQLRPGIRAELIAAEPLVVDPIAMCFDEDSRLFVVEMRDYSERRDERLGRIRLLEDTNGDGRMDKSTIFADNLPWPTALLWYDGGLFVGSTPDILYLKDTDNDGKSDSSQVIFTGFGTTVKRLNVQQLINSFTWGLDNRIHGAAGGNGGNIQTVAKPGTPPLELGSSDFSFDPRTLEIRRENGGGQFGMSFDSAGRKFICNNSAHIRQIMYAHDDVLAKMQYALPSPVLDIPVDGPSGPVYRISPEEPWRVLRTKWRVAGLVPGPVEGGGRSSGYFTSATGVTIYRGTALGPDFTGDAFIADVGSNLIHRKKLRPDGVPFKAERADDEQKSEFLASRDLWFRPVAFANAPDGALYFADMYREVIEHPWSFPPNLKKHLDLNSGNDRGRIYRVVSTNFSQPQLPKLSRASNEDLVALLAHPNGWHRDTASRLLFQRLGKNPDAKDLAEKIRTHITSNSYAAIHALNLLNSFKQSHPNSPLALQPFDIARAVRSTNSDVVEVAVRFLPTFPDPNKVTILTRLAEHPSDRVRYTFAWALAKMDIPNKHDLLHTIHNSAALSPYKDDRKNWLKTAVAATESLGGLQRDHLSDVQRALDRQRKAEANNAALTLPATTLTRAEAIKEFSPALTLDGDAAKGRTIYQERCASCHRLNNEGTAVGPDLESVRTAGKELTLINILDPNREVPPRFATVEVSTHDDELHTGIVSNDAANGLTLRQANGVDTFIPRTNIKSTRTATASLMPEGLEAGLTPAALADLLAYINAQ
jgi:putative membrane-bound dehydrogenase-like protein